LARESKSNHEWTRIRKPTAKGKVETKMLCATMASPDYPQKKSTLTVYQRSVVTAVVVLIYLVACCCPALTFDNYYAGNSAPQSTDTWFGWTALLLGWLGILSGVGGLAGELRPWIDPSFPHVRASLGYPYF
jgi:hypothetical protein